jgi:hypothetical protein
MKTLIVNDSVNGNTEVVAKSMAAAISGQVTVRTPGAGGAVGEADCRGMTGRQPVQPAELQERQSRAPWAETR